MGKEEASNLSSSLSSSSNTDAVLPFVELFDDLVKRRTLAGLVLPAALDQTCPVFGSVLWDARPVALEHQARDGKDSNVRKRMLPHNHLVQTDAFCSRRSPFPVSKLAGSKERAKRERERDHSCKRRLFQSKEGC